MKLIIAKVRIDEQNKKRFLSDFEEYRDLVFANEPGTSVFDMCSRMRAHRIGSLSSRCLRTKALMFTIPSLDIVRLHLRS